MDFRGAVLRGWRLLVLLGVVGAVVGYLTAPAPAPTGAAVRPTGWVATTIIGPSGKGSITLGQLYLDIRNPTVLGVAAANANVGVSATQLLNADIVSVVPGRLAAGLPKKGFHNIKIHGLGVTVHLYSSAAVTAVANALANAVHSFLVKQGQSIYDSQLTGLNTQITALNSELGTLNSNGSTSQEAVTEQRVVSEELTTAIRQRTALTSKGAKSPGFKILRNAVAVPVLPKHNTVLSVTSKKSTRILGGLAVGLAIAVGLALLVEVLDKTLRSVRATEEAFDLPVVATVPARGFGAGVDAARPA